MGAKQSSNPRVRTYSNAGQASGGSSGAGLAMGGPSGSGGNMGARARTRSLGSVQNGAHGQPLTIPSTNGGPHGAGSPDSDASTPEEGPFPRGFMQASSLPVHLLPFHGKFATFLWIPQWTVVRVDAPRSRLSCFLAVVALAPTDIVPHVWHSEHFVLTAACVMTKARQLSNRRLHGIPSYKTINLLHAKWF